MMKKCDRMSEYLKLKLMTWFIFFLVYSFSTSVTFPCIQPNFVFSCFLVVDKLISAKALTIPHEYSSQ